MLFSLIETLNVEKKQKSHLPETQFFFYTRNVSVGFAFGEKNIIRIKITFTLSSRHFIHFSAVPDAQQTRNLMYPFSITGATLRYMYR